MTNPLLHYSFPTSYQILRNFVCPTSYPGTPSLSQIIPLSQVILTSCIFLSTSYPDKSSCLYYSLSPLAVKALMKTWRAIPETHTAIPTTLTTFRCSSSHHRVEMVSVITSYTQTHTHTPKKIREGINGSPNH